VAPRRTQRTIKASKVPIFMSVGTLNCEMPAHDIMHPNRCQWGHGRPCVRDRAPENASWGGQDEARLGARHALVTAALAFPDVFFSSWSSVSSLLAPSGFGMDTIQCECVNAACQAKRQSG
jgi:hypothetical protein